MKILVGRKLPNATLGKFGDKGPETLPLSSFLEGKKVALFGLPGAFTRTCSATHLPSFIRSADALRAKGVDHIICLAVNDVFVMKAWGDAHGASEAGVEMLADVASEFAKRTELVFTAPKLGFINRCKRFSAYVVDGEVKILNMEAKSGICELTAGETLLDQI